MKPFPKPEKDHIVVEGVYYDKAKVDAWLTEVLDEATKADDGEIQNIVVFFYRLLKILEALPHTKPKVKCEYCGELYDDSSEHYRCPHEKLSDDKEA